MSTNEAHLFGRIAAANGFATREQVEECLEIQRTGTSHRSLGGIMLEKGYLTQDQLSLILNIKRKRARSPSRRSAELRAVDRSFGAIVLEEGLVTLIDLEDALLEQQRLAGLNLHFRLGEILVAKSRLKPEDVLRILRRQGKAILVCYPCDNHYQVVRYTEGAQYSCPACGGFLKFPKYLDIVSVDAVVEGAAGA